MSLRPRRRPWLLLGGLLAMVVSAGAFALVHLGADARIEVLVVARPVAAGQEVTGADLRTARMAPGPGVEVIDAADAARAIGRTAVVPLAPGMVLVPSVLGPGAWPPAGQAVVAVPVKVGRLADGVVPGGQVLIIPVADPSAPGAASAAEGSASGTKGTASGSRSGASSGASRAVGSLASGTVVAVTAGVDGAGTTVVSLLVPRQAAAAVAGSAADLSLAAVGG